MVRTSYRKEDLAVSRTQAQATRNQPQEEEVLARASFLGCTVTKYKRQLMTVNSHVGYF